MRVALRFAYDGTHFASYARNPGTPSVESALIQALRREGMLDGGFRTGSRTDGGVSALENVGSADLERPHLRGLLPSLQRHLPAGLWVTGVAQVDAGWNPRHAASRTYRLLHPKRAEDLAAMRPACTAFLGRHDMSAFARVEAGRHPERTVLSFSVGRSGRLWSFRARGESFLWGQVRRMVGAVLAVGRGDADVGDIVAALESGEPDVRFAAAPAEGLLLERVTYKGLQWDASAGRLPRTVGDAEAMASVQLAVAQHVGGVAQRQAQAQRTR
ncbi:MAG: tRNA pseudouridine(38-40) synthase TruA [bacterium]